MGSILNYAAACAVKLKEIVAQKISPLWHPERGGLAKAYLKGSGIEIGALHNPLAVSKKASVKYVDRLSSTELRKQYPQLNHLNLVDVDIIDNGETLATIQDDSQDFVIANHFLEHCQNPLDTLINMFRVLKKEGILYLALPDKRYTFDVDRPITPLEHILDDYQNGPEASKYQHFEEWATLVEKKKGAEEIRKHTEDLIKKDYSIHFHVWTQVEMLELIFLLKRLGHQIDIEACLKRDVEFIMILKKL